MLFQRNNSEFKGKNKHLICWIIIRHSLGAHCLQFTLIEGQPLLN